MKPDPLTEGRRWFEQAEHDLAAARLLAENGHFNLACFHCQQSAEKALKGYLLARGAHDLRSHSVAALSGDAATFDPGFRDIKKRAALLDKHYIPTRYPNGLPGGLPSEAYGAEDSDTALKTATEVLGFVRVRLDTPRRQ